MREQIFTAALDLHYFPMAREQLDALVARFPASQRVKVFEGMMFECQVCVCVCVCVCACVHVCVRVCFVCLYTQY